MFGITGITIKAVDDGTEIKCPKTGETFTVTATNAVTLNSTMYTSHDTYEKIKSHPDVKSHESFTQPIKTGERL